MDIADEAQINELIRLAEKINTILQTFFQRCQITLVDFKLEFRLRCPFRLEVVGRSSFVDFL